MIPSRAVAKLSFRLAPNQNPRAIERPFREFVRANAPPAVRLELRTVSSARPATIDRNHPAVRVAALACRQGFGAPPVFLRCGGTAPMITMLQDALNLPVVLMGLGLPDDRIHAPNEKFSLPVFFKAIATSIWFLTALGARRFREPETRAAAAA